MARPALWQTDNQTKSVWPGGRGWGEDATIRRASPLGSQQASTGRHHCAVGECVIVSIKHTEQTSHKAAAQGVIDFSSNGACHDRRVAPASCLSQDQDQLLQEHFLSSLAGFGIGREAGDARRWLAAGCPGTATLDRSTASLPASDLTTSRPTLPTLLF